MGPFANEDLKLQPYGEFVCILGWGVGVLFGLWWDYVVAEFEIQ